MNLTRVSPPEPEGGGGRGGAVVDVDVGIVSIVVGVGVRVGVKGHDVVDGDVVGTWWLVGMSRISYRHGRTYRSRRWTVRTQV